MKARRKVDFGYLDVGHQTLFGLLLFVPQLVQSQSFSEKKNLHELREAVFIVADSGLILLKNKGIFKSPQTTTTAALIPSPQSLISNQSFLPRWSAEELPFFCRIEHKFAKKNAVPFKFRLGSVDYVDWLEGKGEQSSFRH